MNGDYAFFAAQWLSGIFYLAVIGCSVFGFVLFVKVARRGIKALDIYIYEKSNKGI